MPTDAAGNIQCPNCSAYTVDFAHSHQYSELEKNIMAIFVLLTVGIGFPLVLLHKWINSGEAMQKRCSDCLGTKTPLVKCTACNYTWRYTEPFYAR